MRIAAASGALAWILILHAVATAPSADLPATLPWGLVNLMHAATHAVLAVLLLRSFCGISPREAAWPGIATGTGRVILLLTLVHGLHEEGTQIAAAGRSCSLADLVLDLFGAVAVLVAPWPRGAGRPLSWKPLLWTLLAMVLAATALGEWSAFDGLLAPLLKPIADAI